MLARVMMGVAIDPKATGAVLPTRASTAALIGLKPSAMSMTEVMATGVPKPARPSMSAPKAKATIMAWIRLSSEIAAKDRRRIAKCPVVTVML